MFIPFNLKKYNTSGLSYKDDGQIPTQKIQNGKIINTNSIPFIAPYKIQVRASKMVNGKRTNIKRILEYSPTKTLLEAIKESSLIYNKLMAEINIQKHKKNELTENSLFSSVWAQYLNYKVEQYKGRDDKTKFDRKEKEGFYTNYLENSLANKPVNQVTHEDLIKIISKMKNKRTGKPLSERTKRKVYQFINPVYKFLKMRRIHIDSPATMDGLPPLDNTRKIDLSIDEIKDLFLKLKNYEYSPFREVFIWLMHGRRTNEVLTLKWENIDLKKDIYTIKKTNNKARVDMSYILTPRLKNTLITLGIKNKGYVFTALTDQSKPLSDDTVRVHWEKLNLTIVKHQIRNCIQVYLKNEHAISRDIVDSIIGHKQSVNVGDRYGNYQEQILSNTLNLMLDEIFDDEFSKKIEKNYEEKIEKLKAIFPEKSKKELENIIKTLI
ncbi:tyrosine-type recombinase/integrase [Arcobacter sp.]|uniref:tyrosine-type recombinase/integrase n=1 Tax=unclassified Arcobacter TaxID=2593671 RepID=UPI003B00A32F